MSYGKYKKLTKRTESVNVLRDKAFKTASDPKYDGYQSGLASMAYIFLIKNPQVVVLKFMSNQQLADELHEPIIRKFNRERVYSSFKGNIWGADLANMQLISKYNKGITVFYVSLIFLANMLELMYFKVFQTI